MIKKPQRTSSGRSEYGEWSWANKEKDRNIGNDYCDKKTHTGDDQPLGDQEFSSEAKSRLSLEGPRGLDG